MVGSLDKAIIPCFSRLSDLKQLLISNCGEEDNLPLYVAVRPEILIRESLNVIL